MLGAVSGFGAVAETERRAKFSWNAQSDKFDGYRIFYKRKARDTEWFPSNVSSGSKDELTVFDLEPDTEYQARMQGVKSGNYGSYSELITFTTPAPKVVACGQESDSIPKADLNRPLLSLQPGMILLAGDLEVVVEEAEPLVPIGFYKGTGRVIMPYLAGAALACYFDRIYVDANHTVGEGRINIRTASIEDAMAGKGGSLVRIDSLFNRLSTLYGQLRESLSRNRIERQQLEAFISSTDALIADSANYDPLTISQLQIALQTLRQAERTEMVNSSVASAAEEVVLSSEKAQKISKAIQSVNDKIEAVKNGKQTAQKNFKDILLIGDLILDDDYDGIRGVISPYEEQIKIPKGATILYKYLENQGLSSTPAIALQEPGKSIFVWDQEKKWYVNKSGELYSNLWAYELMNIGVKGIRPLFNLADSYVHDKDPFVDLKESYKNYDGNLVEFVTKLVKDGVVEVINDVKSGGRRRSQSLLGIAIIPKTSAAVGVKGVLGTLSSTVGKYGLKVFKKSALQWAVITHLNVELFKFTVREQVFIFNKQLQKITSSGLKPLYRMENIRYIADEVSQIQKQGSIELLKDGSGNVFWREVVQAGEGFLVRLNKFPKLELRVQGLRGVLRTQFLEDFSNSSDDLLTLLEKETELIDDWASLPSRKAQSNFARAWDLIEEHRLSNNLPNFEGNTIAYTLTPDGIPYFGYNSAITPALQASEMAVRRRWFTRVDWSPKTYSRWQDAQALLHAEAHSLVKAYEAQGTLPEKIIMFVDRQTCGLCIGQIPYILKSMGVKEIKIIQWKYHNGLLLESIILYPKP